MAIDKPMKLANQFWSIFSKRNILLILAFSSLSVFFSFTVLILVSDMTPTSINLWIIVFFISLFNTLFTVIISIILTRPLKKIIGAVLHISGEITNITPPNPNSKSNEKSGLKDAIQTIYSLSSNNKNETNNNIGQVGYLLNETLSNTSCGIVSLDGNRKIIYSNKAAPISINTEGESSLSLIFNNNDSIGDWLNLCEDNAIKAEKVWTRIPDKLPNQENRRFFDVIATYEKGNSCDTTIVLIDRTSSYLVDEENLDFISFAAHELRGPITVIRGYLDVLNDELDEKFEGDQKELFRRLIVSSNRLSNYIDNILNTSRYDRRHLKLHLVEDSISSIYDTISDDMNLRSGAQNRLLSVNLPSDLPSIAADRASISEVLGNLIDNAIKYSNEGGVINVNGQKNGDYIQVDVEDHGIGMPASVVTNLFQKFYRSHRSRETVSGTGIGLYISKAIVESHGGTITVRSEEGKGSIFTILLPIYSTVVDKLQTNHNINESLISEGNGWIRNHSMYRS